MRYLILFFSLNLFGINNWVTVQGLNDCKERKPYTIYMNKVMQEMYDITGKDCETYTIQDVQVDDPEKPIYAAKENATSCKIYPIYAEEGKEPNADDCRYLIRSENIGTMETPNLVYPLCSKSDFYALYVDNKDGTFEAYCTKFLGYGKKIEKRLLEDATLKAAKEAKEAQELADKQAKELEKSDALNFVKEKKGKVDKLSKTDLDLLIEKILILLGQ